MSILSKPTYRFNPIPIKILARLSVNIGKFILKFIWKGKGTKMAKIILKTFRKKKKERERENLWDVGLGKKFSDSIKAKQINWASSK